MRGWLLHKRHSLLRQTAVFSLEFVFSCRKKVLSMFMEHFLPALSQLCSITLKKLVLKSHVWVVNLR